MMSLQKSAYSIMPSTWRWPTGRGRAFLLWKAWAVGGSLLWPTILSWPSCPHLQQRHSHGEVPGENVNTRRLIQMAKGGGYGRDSCLLRFQVGLWSEPSEQQLQDVAGAGDSGHHFHLYGPETGPVMMQGQPVMPIKVDFQFLSVIK